MPNLQRVRTTWSGSAVVGPGVSTFYVDEGVTGFIPDFDAFWDSLASLLPVGVTLSTLNSGDLIDIDTGALTGTWTDAGTATTTGTASGTFALGVGAVINWRTSGIRNGRRVRGSTFIVPIADSFFDTSGTLSSSAVTALNAAPNTLITAVAGLRIWSRPGPLGNDGQSNTVVSADVPDRPSWLRSRRT